MTGLRVAVTGAGGYIGSTLVDVLLREPTVGGRRVEALALLDWELPAWHHPTITRIEGDLAGAASLDALARFDPDVTIHLAAIPGGASEADYRAGRHINLDTTLALFETLADLPRPGRARPIVVYASSIAVYGTALPALVTPATPLRPPITYGAHKLACEILLADFSRRGRLDGRSLRLPGIVARPRSSSGLTSAFMSELLHALAAGEPFTCPVGPQATAWWMSARRCADNLVHAAAMDVSGADPARAWPLPVLHLSIADVVRTLAEAHGADRAGLVTYAPQPAVEAIYGNYPPLDDSAARALGLRDDGTPRDLVQRALEGGSPGSPPSRG